MGVGVVVWPAPSCFPRSLLAFALASAFALAVTFAFTVSFAFTFALASALAVFCTLACHSVCCVFLATFVLVGSVMPTLQTPVA